MAYVDLEIVEIFKKDPAVKSVLGAGIAVFSDHPDKDTIIDIIGISEGFSREDAILIAQDREFILCGYKSEIGGFTLFVFDWEYGEIFIGYSEFLGSRPVERFYNSSDYAWEVKSIRVSLLSWELDTRGRLLAKQSAASQYNPCSCMR